MDDTRITPNASQQYLMDNQDNQQPASSSVSLSEWTIVFILCFVNLINYMDRFTPAGVLSSIQAEFKINDSEAGLLQTAFIVSYMVFAPFFGYLGDRYNRKVIMSFGIFLWCLTTFIGSFMLTYGYFLFFRTLVGIGEASYSTIAPTIISDLFVKNIRSKMLAMFYFAIPVGSGLGYITGGEMSRIMNDWRWGLRVTPILGAVAIVLIIFFVRDPARGEKEGGSHMSNTSWSSDISALLKNRSFMLSTAGFTCVSFITGALAFWGPTFIEYGLKLQSKNVELEDVAYKFGVIAMTAGLIGVPSGAILAQKLKVRWPNADPLICAFGLLISAPLLFFGAVYADSNSLACYTLIFFGQLAINLNWSIVADMLLYVVIPTRRSTAEAFQILIAHAFGDAGSPYLVGVMSDSLKKVLLPNFTLGFFETHIESMDVSEDNLINFRSLQYALFATIFIQVLGSLFFFFTALYIENDKAQVDLAVAENATKQCFSNGTWHPYSDYSQCKELPFSGLHQMDPYVELKSQLYIAGYGISFSTLVIAVIIYLYYRELRCLRNVIHTNLMVTYILADFLWIITTELQLSSTNIPLCIISYSLTRYFQLTNFFWMFVEGLYLYMLVVKTFSGDTIKLKMCLFIGWGLPLLITGVWTVAKSSIENNLTKQKNEEKDLLEEHCALMMKHQYDWVYELSAISVLCINVVFLFAIMWVLITKLRSANTVETQQYRKAAKALLVLIPLLGVSYILTLYGPTEGRAGKVFQCFRAILLSSQGLSVALFYCFLNSEVRNALRHHWERWRTERSLGTGQRYHAQLFAPCSRTESMSLYYLSDCTVDQPLQSQHQTTILKKPH